MERNIRRTIQGTVISNKNDKTITVLVETYKKHAKYGKRVKYSKKYYAHDELNKANVGDVVTIMETRKLSALKRFVLVSIDKLHQSDIKQEEERIEQELEKEVEEEISATKQEEVKEEKKEEN